MDLMVIGQGKGMSLTRSEAKIVVAKLIELAYSKDKGTTVKILAKAGSSTLGVDRNGKATLSGSVGFVTFDGDPVLRHIGAKIKRVNISLNNRAVMGVGYTATFDLAYLGLPVSVSVEGRFDLEELITSCSGLLCRAAHAMKGRHDLYERELESVMGN